MDIDKSIKGWMNNLYACKHMVNALEIRLSGGTENLPPIENEDERKRILSALDFYKAQLDLFTEMLQLLSEEIRLTMEGRYLSSKRPKTSIVAQGNRIIIDELQKRLRDRELKQVLYGRKKSHIMFVPEKKKQRLLSYKLNLGSG